MSVNWEAIRDGVMDCKSFEDIEKLLGKSGVQKGEILLNVKRSVRDLAGGRVYRRERNQSMSAMRRELNELRAKVKSS